MPLEQVARAAGYRHTLRVGDAALLDAALKTFFLEAGPAMLLVEVEKGNHPDIGRIDLFPPALTSRFRQLATAQV